MKKQLQLKDIDPIIFAGPSDQNIRLIEDNFNSKIVLRGNQILLDGEKKELLILETLIDDIIFTINEKGFIDNNDVGTLISSSNDSSKSKNRIDDVILFTPKGKVVPKTQGQKKYYEAVLKNDIVFAVGPAGTGKTYTGVAMAVKALKEKHIKKIILTRPAVEAGENLGYLPGDLKEKLDPYMQPLYDALTDMIPRNKLEKFLEDRTIEIAPLAFMRGRTLDNAFVILDEAQNTTPAQMKMFLTRMGMNAKFMVTGDPGQVDLPKKENSGLREAIKILSNKRGIKIIYLDDKDVIRHPIVKKVIDAYNNVEKDN